VGANLFDKRISIFPGLRKEQDSGGVAINAMDDKGPLSL
jgi:hypothetical protein